MAQKVAGDVSDAGKHWMSGQSRIHWQHCVFQHFGLAQKATGKMSYESRAYRVLIASPSDVKDEREASVRVIQDWNNLHSQNRRVVLLPVRWETHTAPEYNVRPQEAINRRIVDDCDLLVGIFWTKLGTPTGEADSGTLEEIERAAKAGKPVMLYFSHVPVDPNKLDLAQTEKLRAFKERVMPNALIETFDSSLDFRDIFAKQLEIKVRDLQRAEEGGQPVPLELEFVSLASGKPAGSSFAVAVHAIEPSTDASQSDLEQRRNMAIILQRLRMEAATAPVALTIKNLSVSGIRDVYVEVSVRCIEGNFRLSGDYPTRSEKFWQYRIGPPPNETERALGELSEKLAGTGLAEEGGEWRFRFEWDALQPQRTRLIKPFYLTALEPCKASILAKVYADSFAQPLVLVAELSVAISAKIISAELIIAEMRKLAETGGIPLGISTTGKAETSVVGFTSEALGGDEQGDE